MDEKVQEVEKGCSNDACFHTKKAILATKKVVEEVFHNIGKDYPGMSIEETYLEQNGQIIPKVGIFPSSIINIPTSVQIPQPLKIMFFINVLNGKKEEIELSYGWTFGPDVNQEKEEIYVKLLDVVSIIRQEKGALYRGVLNQDIIQAKVKEVFPHILQEYKQILEDLGM